MNETKQTQIVFVDNLEEIAKKIKCCMEQMDNLEYSNGFSFMNESCRLQQELDNLKKEYINASF